MKAIGYLLATTVTALLFIKGTESGTQVFRNRRSIRVCTPRDVARIGHFLCKRSISSLEGPDEPVHTGDTSEKEVGVNSNLFSNTEAFEATDRNESKKGTLPDMFIRFSEQEGLLKPANGDDLKIKKLQKRSSRWPRRKFETIGDIRRYCCHHDCPLELFIAECA